MLVAVLAFFENTAEIAVEDFAFHQGENHSAEDVPIVAGDVREFREVHGLIVFHLGANTGKAAHSIFDFRLSNLDWLIQSVRRSSSASMALPATVPQSHAGSSQPFCDSRIICCHFSSGIGPIIFASNPPRFAMARSAGKGVINKFLIVNALLALSCAPGRFICDSSIGRRDGCGRSGRHWEGRSGAGRWGAWRHTPQARERGEGRGRSGSRSGRGGGSRQSAARMED